jgi:hypothetical protein
MACICKRKINRNMGVSFRRKPGKKEHVKDIESKINRQ